MAASLAPACCSVSELVRHALRCSGEPFHGNLGRGMAGGSQKELELRETPCLCPRRSYEDVGVHRAQEIRDRITWHMDLLERGLHVGLVGGANEDGAAREGRSASGGKEEDDAMARHYHDTLLSGKLRQAVRWATEREGGGCLLPDDQ